jgi:hypothetical protein
MIKLATTKAIPAPHMFTQLPAGCSKSVQCGAIITVSSFRWPCKLLDEII